MNHTNIDKNKLLILNEKLKAAGLKQDITRTLMLEWVNLISDNLKPLRRRFRRLEREKDIQPYLVTNFIFSLLIDADKSEVVLEKVPERSTVIMDYTIVDYYKSTMDIKKLI